MEKNISQDINQNISQSLYIKKHDTERLLFSQTLIGGILPIVSKTKYYLKYQPVIDYFPKEISEKILSNYPLEDLFCSNDYDSEEDTKQEEINMKYIDNTEYGINREDVSLIYDSDFELYDPIEEDNDKIYNVYEDYE